MSALIVLGASLMLGLPDGGGAVSTDRAAYESAKAKAGHGSEANTKLALWCEAHGM